MGSDGAVGQISRGSSNGATSWHSNGGSINLETGMQINGRNWGMKLSMSKSLRTTIALIRKVAEDCHTFFCSSEQPKAASHHLTDRTIQIPDRLKPSQCRKKLMRLATEVTALESHLRHVHPVCYGAAVLFETAVDKSISNGLASKFSQSTCNDNKESMDPFARLCHSCCHRRHGASKRENSRQSRHQCSRRLCCGSKQENGHQCWGTVLDRKTKAVVCAAAAADTQASKGAGRLCQG